MERSPWSSWRGHELACRTYRVGTPRSRREPAHSKNNRALSGFATNTRSVVNRNTSYVNSPRLPRDPRFDPSPQLQHHPSLACLSIPERSPTTPSPKPFNDKQVFPLGQHHLYRGAANHKQRPVAGKVYEAPAGDTAPQRQCPGRPQRRRQCHPRASHRRWRRGQRGGCYRCDSSPGLQNVAFARLSLISWSAERLEDSLQLDRVGSARLRRQGMPQHTVLCF